MTSRIHRGPLSTCVGALVWLPVFLGGCATQLAVVEEADIETLARTQFTGRIENFFEYTPLKSGQMSEFLIHLTDLTDGLPVAEARVELSVLSRADGTQVSQTTALVGRVTGIYVAELVAPGPGIYDIEFRVQSDGIDETMLLTGFDVE